MEMLHFHLPGPRGMGTGGADGEMNDRVVGKRTRDKIAK